MGETMSGKEGERERERETRLAKGEYYNIQLNVDWSGTETTELNNKKLRTSNNKLIRKVNRREKRRTRERSGKGKKVKTARSGQTTLKRGSREIMEIRRGCE